MQMKLVEGKAVIMFTATEKRKLAEATAIGWVVLDEECCPKLLRGLSPTLPTGRLAESTLNLLGSMPSQWRSGSRLGSKGPRRENRA